MVCQGAPEYPSNKKLVISEKPLNISHQADSKHSLGNTKENARVNWCFTFHTPNEEDVSIFKKFHFEYCKYSIFSFEHGQCAKTPHIQGYFTLIKKLRFKTLKELLPYTVHLEAAKGSKNDNINYIKKEQYKIWINGVKQRLIKRHIYKDLFKWQQNVVNIVKDNEPDDRTIYWIYDNKGGTGKSTLTKYLYQNFQCIAINGKFKTSDVKYIYSEYLKKDGVFPEVLVFNTPRNVIFKHYDLLEEFKDGIITSGKYESVQLEIPPPHIIITANHYPDVETLTADRWRIMCLDEDSPEFKPLTLEEGVSTL